MGPIIGVATVVLAAAIFVALTLRHSDVATYAPTPPVPRDAGPELVRMAWKDLIRKHHPDLVARRNAPAITHLAEELTILANRVISDVTAQKCRGCGGDRQVDQEDRAPAEGGSEDAAEDGSGGQADSRHATPHAPQGRPIIPFNPTAK